MTAASGQAPRTGRFPTLVKYDVLEELGHGGMATVYRAHDKRLGRDVALKVIHPHLRDSLEVAHRFFVEAKAVAKLRHPNIVEVYDVSGEDEQEQYLVVELLRGLTLRKLLQTHGAIPPEVAAAIGIELLGALAHAHTEGVVHRDIKPENVIIEHRAVISMPANSREGARVPPSGAPPTSLPAPASRQSERPGDRVLVKLTDFGIAKLLDAQGMTSTGQVLGSPAHMAPEQIEGGEVDGRADVFGLGVLLYECMVGHLPFEGNNPAQVLRRVLDGQYPNAEGERATVGKAWSLILDRALARSPEDRYDDAVAFRDALSQELGRLGISSPRSELESWSDDPDGFARTHDNHMIKVLCDRALEARRRNDAMAAAGDYNRALAYAPHDPALLRIVTRMHRAEARQRALRRVAPLVFGTLAMGALAFVLSREIQSRRQREAEARVEPLPSTSAFIGPDPTGTPSASASGMAVASASAPPRVTAVPLIAKSAVPAKARTIELEVFPRHGVDLAVDGDPTPALDLSKTTTLTLDSNLHTLKFTCKLDICFPTQRIIEPGERAPARLDVRLQIKPATLLIHGDPLKEYTLADDSSVKLVAGAAANSIAMTDSGQRPTSVVEVVTNRKISVVLLAGQQKEVSFLDDKAE
jgi:serine/threonine protein kinase